MQDNTRYTAMRLFQDIEGADTIYINTYAATTPRLQAFKSICNNAKDNGEDHVDSEEEMQEAAKFSRDLFRVSKWVHQITKTTTFLQVADKLAWRRTYI